MAGSRAGYLLALDLPQECRSWVTKEQGEGLRSVPMVPAMMPLFPYHRSFRREGRHVLSVSTVWGSPVRPLQGREGPAKNREGGTQESKLHLRLSYHSPPDGKRLPSLWVGYGVGSHRAANSRCIEG